MKNTFFLLALLAACAQQPVYQPVDVETPIAVPCEAPAVAQPDWPLRKLTPQSPLFDKVKTALAELELRKGYEAELEAAVKSCESQPPSIKESNDRYIL